MSWETHYIENNETKQYLKEIEWVEQHINGQETIRLTKRKKGKEEDNYGKTYRITVVTKKAKEKALEIIPDYYDIDLKQRGENSEVAKYVTNDIGQAIEFIQEIKELLN